jgi:antitoxin (DNA-binding transcriptional repressor) of toxin-antitoxin stability system
MCYIDGMTRIGVRELRQHASQYLGLVKGGATIEVTERGELVALLVPPNPALSARERLVAQSRLTPATATFRAPARRLAAERAASAVLSELRSERLR